MNQIIAEMGELEMYKQERMKYMQEKNKHPETFGIKDYELEDYTIDGFKPSELSKSIYEIDPVSTLDPDFQV